MIKAVFLVSVLVRAAAGPAYPQQTPAVPTVGLPSYLLEGYFTLKLNLTGAADKMAGADYGFRPGSMPEVRTFGQVLAHVTGAQSAVCAAAKGAPDPNQGHDLERELKTKAELTEALADSFAFCDAVFTDLNDDSAMELVRYGQAEITRGALLAYLLVHSSEMYGITTVYLRSKDLIPPSTERENRSRPQ